MISSFQQTSYDSQVTNCSSISSAEDTTPLRGVKAKPYGCSAALRSLDTPSLAWSEVLALMEKRKKTCLFSFFL
jgi:hypothetical protein